MQAACSARENFARGRRRSVTHVTDHRGSVVLASCPGHPITVPFTEMVHDGSTQLAGLRERITACRACPRLVEWREAVAASPRRAFQGQEYWGKPLAGFGDDGAQIVFVGLAPAAHGGNRTGRMFTGDQSGDFLFGALFRAGLANQPISVSRDDGLQLDNAYITAAVRCAPPDNKPSPAERDACEPFLAEEIGLLTNATVFVALGEFAYKSLARLFQLRAAPRFGHGVTVPLGVGWLVCSYHPSQQNVFTKRLTPEMMDSVCNQAIDLATRR